MAPRYAQSFFGGWDAFGDLRKQQMHEQLQREDLALRRAAEERQAAHFRMLDEDRTREYQSKQQERTYKQMNDETAYTRKLFEQYPEPEAAPFLSSVQRAIDYKTRGIDKMPRPEWMPGAEQDRPSPDFVGPMPEGRPEVDPERVMSEGQQRALEPFKRAAKERQAWMLSMRQASHAPQKPYTDDLNKLNAEIKQDELTVTDLETGTNRSQQQWLDSLIDPQKRADAAKRLRAQLRMKKGYQAAVMWQRHRIRSPDFNPNDYIAYRVSNGGTAEQAQQELAGMGLQ